MKKFNKLLLLLAVVLTALAGTTNAYAKDSSGDYVVIIDPGHGGNDGGASSVAGDNESDLNWQIARYFKAELETYSNIKVYVTRGSNEWFSNTGRAEMGLALGADLAISVHNNSTTDSGSRGVLTIGSVNPVVSSSTKSLALAISSKVSQLGLPLAGTNGYMSKVGSDGSSDYYTFIEAAVKSGIPAVIIEHCFLSNSTDAAFVHSSENQMKLGIADATAVAEHLGLSKRTVATDESVTLERSYSVQVVPSNAVNGETPVYTSSNANVAYVNNSGLVTAVSAGSTVISYKYSDGTSGSCTVNVNSVKLVGVAAGVNPTYYQDANIGEYSKDRVMVKAVYSDGSVKQVSNSSTSISDFDTSRNGKQSLTVSYSGLTNTFSVYKNAGPSGSYNLNNNNPKGTAYDIFAYPGQVSSNVAAPDYSGAGVSSNMVSVVEPATEAPTQTPTQAPTEVSTEASTTEDQTTEEPTTEAPTQEETTTEISTQPIIEEENTSNDDNSTTIVIVIIITIILICCAGAGICYYLKKKSNSQDNALEDSMNQDDLDIDIEDLDDDNDKE